MPIPMTFRIGLFGLLLVTGSTSFAQEPVQTENEKQTVAVTTHHPIMRLTPERLKRHRLERRRALWADINPHLFKQLSKGKPTPPAASLFHYFPYTPQDWNQGNCGNCWVWGGTAAASIDHNVHYGTNDVLSVQWFDSNYNVGIADEWACCGGFASLFSDTYSKVIQRFVPEDNDHANYADSNADCPGAPQTQSSDISTAINYPIDDMTTTVVPTTDVKQSTAIANIKSLLLQNKAIIFSFYLPRKGWEDFETFWENKKEDAIWTGINRYGNLPLDGGHIVALVGYDDFDGSWILVNSWGVNKQRPHGTFKIPQKMAYESQLFFIDENRNLEYLDQFEFDVYNIKWSANQQQIKP